MSEVPVTLPAQPPGNDSPVFRAPWEAQAFAITLRLHEQGLFSWPEWAHALAGEIERAQAAGDADLGDSYYRHWVAALEKLVAAKGAASSDELGAWQRAWKHAFEHTPHGQPVPEPREP